MAIPKPHTLARMSTATTGTGTITLGSTVSSFLSFASAGVSDGDVVSYSIKDGSNSEYGYGTYTASGTTLTRNVVRSTNSNAAISLSGTAEVALVWGNAELGHNFLARNYSLSASVAGSALTIALKDAYGSDPSANGPVIIPFRNATVATGTPEYQAVRSSLSLTISSGSTLGTSNSTAFRVWVVAFDNSGTVVLGAIQCATSTNVHNLAASGIASSTAEGGAGGADSAGVFYTSSAVTSKAYRVLGYLEWSSGLATAGTWSAGPTVIHLYGPETPLPGRVVQMVQGTDSTGFSTTSSSYQTTTLTVAITPTAAANKVKVGISGTAEVNTNARLAFVSIYRDSTRLTGAGGTYVTTGAPVFGPVAQTYLDTPNSTSSITYSAKLRNSDGATTVKFPTSGTGETPYGIAIAEEIFT